VRSRLCVLVAVTSILTVASPAYAGPPHDASSDLAYVERIVFAVSLGDVRAAATHGDPWFDWSTDHCSSPLVGSTGRSFDFTAACTRHDFGYRNVKLLERRYGTGATYWNGAMRQRIDDRFLTDMRDHCRIRSVFLQPTCMAWAATFHRAVRLWGGP